MKKYPKIEEFVKKKGKLVHSTFGDLPISESHPYFIDSATIGHLWIYDMISKENFDYIVPLLNYAQHNKTCLFEWNINDSMYKDILLLFKDEKTKPVLLLDEKLNLHLYYDLLENAKTHRNEFNALSKLLVILHKREMIGFTNGVTDFTDYPSENLVTFLKENAPFINAFYLGATTILEDEQFDMPEELVEIIYKISKCETKWKELKYYPKQIEISNTISIIEEYFIENWNWFDEKDKILFLKYIYNLRVIQELVGSLIGTNGILSALSLRVIFDNYWQSKYLVEKQEINRYFEHCLDRMQLYYAKDIKDEKSFDIFKIELNKSLYRSIPLNPDFFRNAGNVRKICTDLGIKEHYDKYYEFNSEFVHGSISALFFGLLDTCTNKEHLEHLTINKAASKYIDSLSDIFVLLNLHSQLINDYLEIDFLPHLDINDYVFKNRAEFNAFIKSTYERKI